MNVREHYDATVDVLWSGSRYATYKEVDWSWRYLPFQDDYTVPRVVVQPAPGQFVAAKSIIEIGSAMGQGYRFLRDTGVVEVDGYVGYDVSRDGQEFCHQTYPEARWIEGDFSKMSLEGRFEFAFERHAIHHMPDPLKQFEKVIDAVEKAACFTFRGRVTGDTVSDLEISYFNHTTELGYANAGRVFMNLINVMDVVQLAVERGFNHIGVGVGLHEPIQGKDPDIPGMYLSPDAKAAGGPVLRFNLFMARKPGLTRPLYYAYAGQRRCALVADFYRLRRRMAKLASA